ncbi:outer membrane murein-binding lipoprotein Lpp [Parvibaculum indicum]|uniref:hypothetical protein n=1 Tax=Parvibaculum indicum TaxID=562969 RepID=UPI0014205A8A|nr:hypothetical protein [Parvibaculum indicum]NIJ42413.1 outer membrane murein-binding lipoprotein Lpp [Parvibaculum indicum]
MNKTTSSTARAIVLTFGVVGFLAACDGKQEASQDDLIKVAVVVSALNGRVADLEQEVEAQKSKISDLEDEVVRLRNN